MNLEAVTYVIFQNSTVFVTAESFLTAHAIADFDHETFFKFGSRLKNNLYM